MISSVSHLRRRSGAVTPDGCREGTPLSWSGGCVGYSFKLDELPGDLPEGEVRAAVRAAFDTWQEADCGDGAHPSLVFVQLDDVSCDVGYTSRGGNANLISFPSTWSHPDSTALPFNEETGEIYDADIEFNTAEADLSLSTDSAAEDFATVALHQAGHFIGLDHSPDPTSVMFATSQLGERRTVLSADDISGVCTIYPPDRDTSCDPTPRGGLCSDVPRPPCGCALGSPRAPSTGAGGLIVGLALALLRRRKLVSNAAA